MNNNDPLDRRIKRALKKLTKLQKRFFWFRLLLWLVAYSARRYVAGLFVRPRAQVHWVGSHRRSRRRERTAAISLLITAIVLLEPYEFALWSLISGAALSLFLILASLYRFVPRKRSRWEGET